MFKYMAFLFFIKAKLTMSFRVLARNLLKAINLYHFKRSLTIVRDDNVFDLI